jgi:uncharacterized membrane protein YdbT with pleckstrin-like domain
MDASINSKGTNKTQMFLACEVIEYKFSCITKKVATNALEYKHTFPLIHETSISSTSYIFSASHIKELTCGETTLNQRAEDRTIIMNSKEVLKGQGRVVDTSQKVSSD